MMKGEMKGLLKLSLMKTSGPLEAQWNGRVGTGGFVGSSGSAALIYTGARDSCLRKYVHMR